MSRVNPALIAKPALIACAVATAALTGCGSGSSASTGASAPAAPLTSSSTPTPSATPTTIPVKKSAAAPDFGHTWTALQVVRNFPDPLPDGPYGEIVLVQLSVTAGDKFYTSLREGDFVIIDDAGAEALATTSVVTTQMAASGYKPALADAEKGTSTTGWVAFGVKKPGSTTLTLRFKQEQTKVIGGGGSIPARNIDIKLV